MSQAVHSPEASAIAESGYVFVPAAALYATLNAFGADDAAWRRFADSWHRMPVDRFMADGGRYRRRRHATLRAGADGRWARLPQQPHYQSRDYNPLNGGVQRWFSPVDPVVIDNPATAGLLNLSARTFGALAPEVGPWHVELHQFRIEAAPDREGQPTPEGVHRDGVDYVLVTLIARQNVSEGSTHIRHADGTELGAFTLAAPGDTVLLDDRRVLHGVTPIHPLDPARPAYRDALVITFARRPPGDAPS